VDLIQAAILTSTLLCSLVAGFVLAFAAVVMPGIGNLNDCDALKAFKTMDRIIQDNQPVFIIVWVGSVVALVLSAVLSIWQLDGVERFLILLATAIYLLGVQLSTFTINVPMNNHIQAQDLDRLNEHEIAALWLNFELRWRRWNTIRTVSATITSVLLIMTVLGLRSALS
jgi:uncharacterized membrane protein